jgi:hypothetical protein
MPALDFILKEYCQKLPRLSGEAIYFPSFLFHHLNDYLSAIKTSTSFLESLYKTDELGEREDSFITQLEKIILGLQETINAYLEGLPGEAYEEFRYTINQTYLRFALQASQIRHIRRDQSFYRVRTGPIPDPILPEHLFHIPFEYRKFVSSQRYSIPGFPCLYLGNSLAVSLREIGVFTEEMLSETKVVKITNNSNILVVDIDPYQIPKNEYAPILGNHARTRNDIYQAALLYPLIAACHCKISYAVEAKFKIEYIIPQLLLQWFRETKENRLIQGIRYLSNRIDTKDNPEKMYNYVFPVIDCKKESGFCNNLKHLFNVSDVVNVYNFPFKQTLFTDKVAELESHLVLQKTNIL